MPILRVGQQDGIDFVRRLSRGDADAAEALHLERPDLEQVLRSIGASPSDAAEIVSNVLGDCCKSDGGKLAGYRGTGTLPAYLRTIVRRAWIDWVRHDSKTTALPDDPAQRDQLLSPGEPEPAEPGEDEVVAILKEALLGAFAATDPERLLILRLIYEHRLLQKDLRTAWDCSAATLSRRATETLDDLRRRVLAIVREQEPNLQLEWEDFLALCADSDLLFSSAPKARG